MPYIAEQRRRILKAGGQAENVGELTYLLTDAIIDAQDTYTGWFEDQLEVEIHEYLYVDRVGDPRFKDYAEVIGALGATLLEYDRREGTDVRVRNRLNDFIWQWYGRVVGPYEDQKIIENGDVYPDVKED